MPRGQAKKVDPDYKPENNDHTALALEQVVREKGELERQNKDLEKKNKALEKACEKLNGRIDALADDLEREKAAHAEADELAQKLAQEAQDAKRALEQEDNGLQDALDEKDRQLLEGEALLKEQEKDLKQKDARLDELADQLNQSLEAEGKRVRQLQDQLEQACAKGRVKRFFELRGLRRAPVAFVVLDGDPQDIDVLEHPDRPWQPERLAAGYYLLVPKRDAVSVRQALSKARYHACC